MTCIQFERIKLTPGRRSSSILRSHRPHPNINSDAATAFQSDDTWCLTHRGGGFQYLHRRNPTCPLERRQGDDSREMQFQTGINDVCHCISAPSPLTPTPVRVMKPLLLPPNLQMIVHPLGGLGQHRPHSAEPDSSPPLPLSAFSGRNNHPGERGDGLFDSDGLMSPCGWQ